MMAACEKVIPIDVDDLEPMVVVQGLNSSDAPVELSLCYSRPVYGRFYVLDGDDYFTKITDATVTLAVDNAAPITATQDSGRYIFSHIPQPGEHLELSVAIPGRETVTATADVPAKPSVRNIDAYYEQPDEYSYFYDVSLSFDLTDKAATSDYYSIRIWQVDTMIYSIYDDYGNITGYDTNVSFYYRYFNCTDYLINNNSDIADAFDIEDPTTAASTYSGTEMNFTDAAFNGQTHRFKIDINQGGYYGDEYYKGKDVKDYSYRLFLEVTSMSRDLYLYRQTMSSYSDDEFQAILSEPVPIHSNIDGGIGIFGVSSTTVKAVPQTQPL